MTDIRSRKGDHIALAMNSNHQSKAKSSFDLIHFEHNPMPELALGDINLTASFLGGTVSAPFIIGAMTGGCENGETINQRLAEAAEQCNIPMALGSQRASLELNLEQNIRRWAPTAIILGNLGATQLQQKGIDLALRAVESVHANALIIHLNPLQELIQPNGDRDWRFILEAIRNCCRILTVPVIIKEVGSGISPSAAIKLVEAGVSGIELAGRGGTSWASIEMERNSSDRDRQVAQPFLDWGTDTTVLLNQFNQLDLCTQIIGSGGVRHGLDIARCIRLGADMGALAQPFLQPALTSTDAVIGKIDILSEQLRWAMFLTGSQTLQHLRLATLATTKV